MTPSPGSAFWDWPKSVQRCLTKRSNSTKEFSSSSEAILSRAVILPAAHKNPKAERIANSLVLYVHGSQNYFNHHTNVDLSLIHILMNEMEYRTIGKALAGGYRAAVYCRLSKDLSLIHI